LANYRAERF